MAMKDIFIQIEQHNKNWMMVASESNPSPALSALLNKSTLSTANIESSEHNKDVIGMNRRKKFIQFPELVDPKKQ